MVQHTEIALEAEHQLGILELWVLPQPSYVLEQDLMVHGRL